jgi:hypothetical protein
MGGPGAVSFETYAESWLAGKRRAEIRDALLLRGILSNHLLPIRDKRPSDISGRCRQFCSDKLAAGYAPESVELMVAISRSFLVRR